MHYLRIRTLILAALLMAFATFSHAEYLADLEAENETEAAWLGAYRNMANTGGVVTPPSELTTLWPQLCTSFKQQLTSLLADAPSPTVRPVFAGEADTPYTVVDWYGEALPIPVADYQTFQLIRNTTTGRVEVNMFIIDQLTVFMGELFGKKVEPDVIRLEAEGDGRYRVQSLRMLQTVQLANQQMFQDSDCTIREAEHVVDTINRYYVGLMLAEENTDRYVYPIPDRRPGFIMVHIPQGQGTPVRPTRYRGHAEWEVDQRMTSFNITSLDAQVANLVRLFGRDDLEGQSIAWVDALSRALADDTAAAWADFSAAAREAGIEVRGVDGILKN